MRRRMRAISILIWIVCASEALAMNHGYPIGRCAETLAEIPEASRRRVDLSFEPIAEIPKTGAIVVWLRSSGGRSLDREDLRKFFQAQRPDVKLLDLSRALVGDPQVSHETLDLSEEKRWLEAKGLVVVIDNGESHDDGAFEFSLAPILSSTPCDIVPAFASPVEGSTYLRFGAVIPHIRVKKLKRDMEALSVLIPFLRAQTKAATLAVDGRGRNSSPIEEPLPTFNLNPRRLRRLRERILELPPQARLVENEDDLVILTQSGEIPALVPILGRARQFVFERIGEGVPGALEDTDRFDSYYRHLVAISKTASNPKPKGAYRIGLATEIVKARGVDGLYVNELFDINPRVFGPEGFGAHAAELGRAFVLPEFQGGNTFDLLWQGIGRFLAMHPKTRILYGVVSMSDRFAPMSRQLLVEFLKRHFFDERLASFFSPRNPPHFEASSPTMMELLDHGLLTLEDLSRVVTQIDGMPLPQLFHIYTNLLNAKIVGFNVDPNFGNALDALVVIDLKEVHPRILKRFIGEAGYNALKANWDAR